MTSADLNALLNTAQVVLLAWIAAWSRHADQQTKPRRRRRRPPS